MSVFRNPHNKNRWQYDFEIEGNRKQGVCKNADGSYCRDEREARRAEDEAYKAAKAKQGMAKAGIRPGSYTFAQAVLRHIAEASVDSSESHIKSLNRISGELFRFFGADTSVVDITDDDISGPARLGRRIAPDRPTEGYRAWCFQQKRRVWLGGPRKITDADYDDPKLWKELDRPRSASEVNHCLDLLRCALDKAHRTRNPQTNDSELPFPPEVKAVHDPERDPRPMPEEEFEARKAKAPVWTREAALVSRYYGLREAEVRRLQLHHLDHEERCLRLRGHETKSGKDQAVYGGERGWILLRWLARRARRRGTTWLITWCGPAWVKKMRRGETPPNDVWRQLKTFRRSWRESAEGIDRPHRFHDVRAKYITEAAKLGSSTLTKGLARHRSMATTEKYIKVADEDLARAADRATAKRPKLKVVR